MTIKVPAPVNSYGPDPYSLKTGLILLSFISVHCEMSQLEMNVLVQVYNCIMQICSYFSWFKKKLCKKVIDIWGLYISSAFLCSTLGFQAQIMLTLKYMDFA